MTAVKSAKRSTYYRRHRSHIHCVAPSDLWIDEDESICFIFFRMIARQEGEMLLGFAVDTRDSQIIQSGVLCSRITPEGWIIENTIGGE